MLYHGGTANTYYLVDLKNKKILGFDRFVFGGFITKETEEDQDYKLIYILNYGRKLAY